MKKLPFSLRLIVSLAFFACAWTSYASEDFSPPTAKKTVTPNLDLSIIDEPGEVKVEAKINKYGFVTDAKVISSTNDKLNTASVDAMHRWIFTPGKRNGKTVSTTVIQPFEFSDGAISLTSSTKDNHKTRSPKAIYREAPRIPQEFANISGQVNFIVDLDSKGTITQITLKESSHEELVAPAQKALKQWKFRPATKEGSNVASTVVAPFRFIASDWSKEKTIMASAELDRVDVQPKPIKKHEPVLPVSLERKKGDAWLLLYVDEHGYVAETDTLKASNDDLAKHAREAALQWKFKPAMKNGLPVAAKISVPFRFTGGLLLSEKKMDKQPRVRQTHTPKLPSGLSGVSGYVRVMLNLDDRGNVVTASAKQSSLSDLEQPTIEAVKKWKFKPALRDGAAVPSTVLVPVTFGKI